MKRLERESSFELLRLLCIYGIICMHFFGTYYMTCTGVDRIYGITINSAFNMGVTIFMLISGYFGIKYDFKKVVKFELIIWTYSIAGVIVKCVMAHSFSLSAVGGAKEAVKAVFPVLTGKYWYMTAYMIILILSPFINQISEKLDEQSFRRLLMILLFFFYIAPTFIYIDIVGDRGKGVINMFIVYLIGRYIKKYRDCDYSLKKLVMWLIIVIGSGTAINSLLTFIVKKSGGMFGPFWRECSITILFGSILIFLIFKRIHFKSRIINYVAGSVIAAYLFEGTVRSVLKQLPFVKSILSNKSYLPFYVTVFSMLVLVICIFIDIIRKGLFFKLEQLLVEKLEKVWITVIKKLQKGI